METLGKQCYLVESGVEIKKYPCCGSAHLALDAAYRLLEREAIKAEQVESIQVYVDFDPPRSLIHARPTEALEGKFSMQYCLAAAILDQKVGLESFTDDLVQRPEAQTLIPKVEMRRIAGYEGRPSWVEAYNEVEVHLTDGRVLSERADRVTQGALRGVSMGEIQIKFQDTASRALSATASNELMEILDKLENTGEIGRMTDLLRGEG